MRALFLIVAAAVTATACSGPGPAGHGRSPTARLASPQTVGCDQIVAQVGQPGGRIVLGVLAAPPAQLERAAPTDARPWTYFAKYGIAVRTGSPAVLITVPEAWRHRAGIGWGNNLGVADSLRLLSCPRPPGAWNVYVGGFYLRSPAGCVPLVFHIGRQTATLTFDIGNHNCGSAGQ